MGARFLKVPTITSTERAERVLLFTLFQDRGFKRRFAETWWNYHLTKRNELVCWLWTAFVFFRFGFEYLFLGRKGYRDFEKRAPVQGNFRTGPTSPFRSSFTIRNIIPARGSSWLLRRSENCILVRNFATASCKRRATPRFSVKSASG